MAEPAYGQVLACLQITGEPPTKKTSGRIIVPALRRHQGLKGYFEHLVKLSRAVAGGLQVVCDRLEAERLEGQHLSQLHDHARELRKELVWATEKVRPIILPSRDFEKAARSAVPQIKAQWGSRATLDDVALHVEACYFVGPRRAPDLQGLFEATADLLEQAGVIKNDYRIASWDGSRRYRDRENPRTEITLSVLEECAPQAERRKKSTRQARENASRRVDLEERRV